jgi:hypothetical protein
VPFAAAGAAAAGLPAAVEFFGLNKSPRLNLPGEGDGVGCVAWAGVALAFFIARCFAGVCDGEGDSAGVGDCACEIQMPANPTRAMRGEIFVIISASVRRRRDYSQSNSGDTRSGSGPERNFSTGLERAGRLRYPLPGGPNSGMPQVGCGGFRRRFCPDETVRGQSYSRRHSQARIQDTADQARYARFIDIRRNAFRVGVAARAEIRLSASDVGFWEAGLSAVALAKADHPM